MSQFEMSGRGRALTSGKSEKPIYYRKPNGWITVNDQLSGTKLRDFSYRGFVPLWQFGEAMPSDDKGNPIFPNHWHVILNHPDGPGEFPLEQIVTFRWYKEPPVPVTFPQLKGVKIREFRCPQCTDRQPFVELKDSRGRVLISAIPGLGRHLANAHGWDRTSLSKYGESVGIDFNANDAVTEIITEWQPAEVTGCDECDYVPDEGKDAAKAIRMHKMSAHKAFEVQTV